MMKSARDMTCLRADGTTIETRKVSSMARYSMQAASDHRAADKAKAELGDELHAVSFGHVTLHFKDGRSIYLSAS